MKHQYRKFAVAAWVCLTLTLGLAAPAWGQTTNPQVEEAQRLEQQATQAYQAGRLDEAIGLAERALALREKAQGREAADVIEVVDGLAQLYYSKGDYQRAETLFLRALGAYEKYLGAESIKVGVTLNYLGLAYQAQADYVHALPLYQRSLAIREKALGPEHPVVAYTLNNMAGLYQDQGDYAKAAPLYQRSLAILEKALGPEHPAVATALNNLAELYRTTGDYAKAAPPYQRSLAILEKALGPEHPTVATALNNVALLYKAQGDYPRALPLYQRSLAIAEKALGPEHPAVAQSLNNLALLYQAQGDYAKAAPLYQRSLAIREKALGPEHPDVANSLGNLAGLYQAQGDYAKAGPLYQRSLAIAEKALGPEHPAVAQSLNNLALLYQAQGDYAKAAPLSQRSLAIREKALGPEHPDVANSLNNLAGLYQAQGDYAKAGPLYQRSLAIAEKALGPEHPAVAQSLNNLALLYQAQGDYAKAAPLYQRSLAIREKALGPEHPDVANSLGNLAGLYQAQGDYAKAAPLYQRSLAIAEKALGPEHPAVAQSLNNLALLYQAQGDYAKAAPLYQRSLAIREKALEPEHPDVASSLNNLAALYQAQGDYAKAAPLYQRSLAIREKALGPEHPDVASSLNNLAALYQAQGDYAKAAPLYQRSLAIREKALGPEHPNVANSLNNLAVLYQAQGDYAQAISFTTRAAEVQEKNIAAFLDTGSQQQKQLYLNTLSGETYGTVSLHAQAAPQNGDAARLAVTTILRRKGRSLDAFAGQLDALRQRANPEDKKLLDDLAAVQSQLANLQLSSGGKLAPEARRAEVGRLEADKERLEDAISRRSAEFRALAQPVTLDAVQQALPADAALVEFFIYRPFNPKAKPNEQYGAARYIAYLLTRDATAPQFADLGDAATIDAEAAKFRNALQSDKSAVTQVKQLARALDARLMQPVRKLLGTTKRVFLSPDSALNLIPFAALVDENDKYLVENYSFNYLTSGRDLLRLQITGRSESGASVVANPQFDLTQPVVNCKAGQRGLGLLSDTPDAKIDYRGTDFTQFCYSTLAGTAQEAAQLGPLLTDAKVLTQKDATEAALKALHRPRLLHIATHGFFFPDLPNAECGMRNADCPHAGPPARNLGLNPPSAFHNPQSENPLLRSGLILAGVKQRRSGPENDGVLTALEAAGLDLFGTKLVVLSACETGLGEVQNGAGVYGLRRALVLAGSETQIMSLWKVSDAATRDLMTSYYTRLQRGEGRSEAMRQVQLELLRNGKLATPVGESRKIEQEGEKGKTGPADWRHPYYWAAFIQSGAGTNLDGR